ncbi:hypothetical protein C8R44DRAFT_826734, partial [Mycena epipterygia]
MRLQILTTYPSFQVPYEGPVPVNGSVHLYQVRLKTATGLVRSIRARVMVWFAAIFYS